MTPEAALAAHSASMTEYEQNEIRDYPEVYFTGPLAEKVPASLLNDESNHGFDDERGAVGHGTYSNACSASMRALFAHATSSLRRMVRCEHHAVNAGSARCNLKRPL